MSLAKKIASRYFSGFQTAVNFSVDSDVDPDTRADMMVLGFQVGSSFHRVLSSLGLELTEEGMKRSDLNVLGSSRKQQSMKYEFEGVVQDTHSQRLPGYQEVYDRQEEIDMKIAEHLVSVFRPQGLIGNPRVSVNYSRLGRSIDTDDVRLEVTAQLEFSTY